MATEYGCIGRGSYGLAHMRRTHGRALVVILTIAGICYILTKLAIPPSEWEKLLPAQQLDIGCFELMFSLWVAYFFLSFSKWKPLRLLTLRTFLDTKSLNREITRSSSINATSGVAKELGKEIEISIREKSQSSRDVQGIMIAIVVLLITLLMVVKNPAPHDKTYTSLLYGSIFLLGLIITLCWVLSIDMFDTIMNAFTDNSGEANKIRHYLYREIGPFRMGAVTYGYIGHALMPIFVLMIFSLFAPTGVAIGGAVYLFLAYPYYFGYREVSRVPEKIGDGQELAVKYVTIDAASFDPPCGDDKVVKESLLEKNLLRNWPSWVFLLVLGLPAVLIMMSVI